MAFQPSAFGQSAVQRFWERLPAPLRGRLSSAGYHFRYLGSLAAAAAKPTWYVLKDLRSDAGLLVAAVIIGHFWKPKGGGAVSGGLFLYSAAALGCLVGGVFIVNLLLAPARLYREQGAALEDAREQTSQEKERANQAERRGGQIAEQLHLASTSHTQLERERNELAAERDALSAEIEEFRAHVFPRGEINVEPYFHLEYDSETLPDQQERSLVFEVRVVNRDPAHRMNLVFDLAYVYDMSPQIEQTYRSRLYRTRHVFRRKFEDDLIPDLLEVDSETTKTGLLAFDWSFWSDEPRFIRFDEPGRFEAGEGSRFVMNVHDYVSGESIEFDVPGKWSR